MQRRPKQAGLYWFFGDVRRQWEPIRVCADHPTPEYRSVVFLDVPGHNHTWAPQEKLKGWFVGPLEEPKEIPT